MMKQNIIYSENKIECDRFLKDQKTDIIDKMPVLKNC